MSKAQVKKPDPRPRVAIGHVEHHVADVAKSAEFLEIIGLRPIVKQRNFAVMELRGGTHIILAKAKGKVEAGTAAPFDLIVDDVDKFRAACVKNGMKASRMSRGSIHDWFELIDPSGYEITIMSSHAGSRPV
jgi:hypothetical protein